MSTNRAVPYPFDVANLNKGDSIAPETCESLIGLQRTDKDYQLKLLSLKYLLERQWLDEKEEVITVRSISYGLLICTDSHAVGVNSGRARHGKRSIERALVRQNGVNRGNIDDQDVLNEHERELVKWAAFLAGGKKEVRYALESHKRSIPGLPKKKGED